MAKHFEGVIFDKSFVLAKELKNLGFRPTDIEDEYLRAIDWVHADFSDELDDNVASARLQARTWKGKVEKLLSRPVGKYAHKKRPHRNLLPMMNSGDLKRSLKVKLKQPKSKVWEYELSVTLGSKHKASTKYGMMSHTDLTNDNITRKGRNKRKVAWRGWADELMDGKGLKGVPSARNLMRSLFR